MRKPKLVRVASDNERKEQPKRSGESDQDNRAVSDWRLIVVIPNQDKHSDEVKYPLDNYQAPTSHKESAESCIRLTLDVRLRLDCSRVRCGQRFSIRALFKPKLEPRGDKRCDNRRYCDPVDGAHLSLPPN